MLENDCLNFESSGFCCEGTGQMGESKVDTMKCVERQSAHANFFMKSIVRSQLVRSHTEHNNQLCTKRNTMFCREEREFESNCIFECRLSSLKSVEMLYAT